MRSLIYSTCFAILSCLFLSSSANTFNITRLLNRYNGYGTFNNLLSQAQLVGAINGRRTITVLAIEDSSISGLASKPQPVIKRILMNHVLLDYYDVQKMRHLKKGSELLTTLYQTTGEARKGNGHINVTDMGNGEVKIGSGVRGSQLDVSLNRLVAAQPYNISVLDVSGPIISPGVDDMYIAPAAPPRKMGPTPAPAPGPHKKHRSPPAYSLDMEDTDDTSDGPTADGPAEDADNAPAPRKSGADKDFKASTLCLIMVSVLVMNFLLAL